MLSVNCDIQTSALFGEALCLFDALLARLREALVAKTDDMNDELVSRGVELLREVTR